MVRWKANYHHRDLSRSFRLEQLPVAADRDGQQLPPGLTVGIAASVSFNDQWNLVLAASLVSLIPLLVIFAVFQKHIVRSLQLTGANR